MSLDDLTTYTVHKILAGKEVCTFERLVVECFESFPEVFSLRGYPEYPDSARVNKSWLRCRTDKGWITGNVKMGFRLTDSGMHVAERTEQKLLSGVLSVTAKRTRKARERGEAIVDFIRRHPSYVRYRREGKGFHITEHELRHMLSCTMETPVRVLRQNLNQIIEILEAYHENDLLSFVNLCAKEIWPSLKRKGR